jgi:hypothetical protein
MGDVIDLWSKQKKTEEELGRELEEMPLQDERCRELQSYLDSLTPEKALETREEDPDNASGLDDLEKLSLDKARNMSGRLVEKIVFDQLADHLARGGRPLGAEQRRALNNLIQLRDVDEAVVKRASIMLVDPAWSRSADELQQRVTERKIELLSPVVGEDAASRLEKLQEILAAEWQGDEWRNELAGRLKDLKVSEENNAAKFMERCAFIGSISFGENDTVDLRHHRMLRDAHEAFRTGDPAAIDKHPGNPYLQGAAETARRGQDEMAEKRTAATARFLREKIAMELAKQDLKAADVSG